VIRRELPILLCAAVGAVAQPLHAPVIPTPAEQQAKLAHLRTNLDDYRQHPPDLTCIQRTLIVKGTEALLNSGHFSGGVTVDVGPRPPNEPHGFPTSFDVAPIIDELLASDAKFTYGWAMVRKKPLEVYRYRRDSDSGLQQANVYTDPDSGGIFRIVFQGFNTPASAQLFCQAEPK
jgi:hypothetical protein